MECTDEIWLIQDIQLWVRMFRLWSAVDYLTPGARVTSVCHSMANLYRTGHTASHLFMKVTHLCLSDEDKVLELSVALLWRNDEVDGDRMWKGRNNLSLGDAMSCGLRLSSPSFNKLSRMRIIVTISSFSWWTIFLLWRNLSSFGNGTHCVQGFKYCRHCVINV